MTKTGFIDYWNKEYPEAFPIGHELKWIYPNRWLRIHSLPGSKRYAESEAEYQIIIDRQNMLFADLIGEGTEITISFGLYTDDITNDNYKELTDFGEFEKALTIDLQKQRPEEYEIETYFEIFVKPDTWERNKKNQLLKAIANDEIRALFICPSKRCIVAPYDGGIDIIVDSSEKRDELKIKYKDWLSGREDGL